MKLPHDMLVLVADGTHILLLKNHGDSVYPELHVIEHRQFENPPNRELLDDAPGLGHSVVYPGRDTVAKGDPHQAREDDFLAAAANLLAGAAQECAGLVVVAPPRSLGVLRRHYDERVRKRLVAEIDKDLVKHPLDEITRLLCAHDAIPER